MKDTFLKLIRWIGKSLWNVGRTLGLLLWMMFRHLGIAARKKWRTFTKKTQQALTIAAALHVIILLAAATVVAIPGKRIQEEIVTTIVERPVIPDVQQQRLSAIKQIRQIQPSASSSVSKMMLANTKAAVNLPTAEVDVRATTMRRGMGSLGLGNGFGKGVGMGSGGGTSFPVEIRGRCIPGERARLLQKNGGTPQVEIAVGKSLDWLADKQSKDGTWGNTYKGSMTGLAVLCYLGRCETPRSRRYGETVTKGIQAILELGKKNKNGYFTAKTESIFPYEHGIATYALGEALAMTKGDEIPDLREGFISGVEKIIAGQTPDGGWVYSYANVGSADLSVTGWQVQALKAAKRLNVPVTGLDACMARAAELVASRQGPKGGFGYRNVGDRDSLAGVGILSLQFLGRPSRTQAENAFRYWFEETPTFSYTERCDLYAAYYINQSIFNYGGSAWSTWNAQFQPEILRNQNVNGSYPKEGNGLSSSQTGSDAELYRTTLATLMLEVYYRYLPVNG